MTESEESQVSEASGSEPGPGGADGPGVPEQRYWGQNLRILAALLSVWFAVSFGLGILFVEPLNQVQLAGFPLGFWFAQQGSIFVFIVLVLLYAVWIERVEHRYWADRDRE